MTTEVPGAADPVAPWPARDPGAPDGGSARMARWRSRSGRWWLARVLVAQVLAAACVATAVLAVTGQVARRNAAAHAEVVVTEIDHRVSELVAELEQVGTRCGIAAPGSMVGYAVVRNGEVVCRQQVEAAQLDGVRFQQGLTFPPEFGGAASVGAAVDGSLVVGLVPTGELVVAGGAGERWMLAGPDGSGGLRSLVPPGTEVASGPTEVAGDGVVIGVVPPLPWLLAAGVSAVALAPLLPVWALSRRVVTPLRRLAGGGAAGGCRELVELGGRLELLDGLVSQLALTGERQGVELRRQMAVELHDGPVQDLATALLVLDLAGGREELGEVRDCIRSGVEELRRLCSDLLPVPVASQGVVRSVRDGAHEVVDGSGLCLIVDVTDAEAVEAVLDEAMSEVLVRNCLEAVRNAVRHSGGTTVSVRLGCEDGSVVAEVTDDGVGMDDDDRRAATRAGHLGLSSMTELVGLVGGSVSFENGGGTTVRIQVPVGGAR